MKILVEIIKSDKASGLEKGQIKNLDKPIVDILVKSKIAKLATKKGETKK